MAHVARSIVIDLGSAPWNTAVQISQLIHATHFENTTLKLNALRRIL